MKETIKINVIFLIGMFGAWTTNQFGNVDSFYLVLLALFLIPINAILFIKYFTKK